MNLLTACITTFNRPDYLKESIESLMNQTSSDFEILILNNGNDKKTLEVINHFKDINNRIYSINHKPISISKQRNLALNHVKTEYIGFLDDDDLWASSKVENFYKFLNNSEIKPSLLYSGFCYFRINKSLSREFCKPLYDPKSKLDDLLHQRGDFTGSASNPIINVNHAKIIGLYDERIKTGEDWEFYLRLAERYEFKSCENCLVYIREHGGPRLGGRLRDAINTDIIIHKRFHKRSKLINQVLIRKISTKLIRINKSRKARKILIKTFNYFSRELFINLFLYIFSFLSINLYTRIHIKVLNIYKKSIR